MKEDGISLVPFRKLRSTIVQNGTEGSVQNGTAGVKRPQSLKKYEFVTEFERKLNVMSWLAIVAAGMRKLERFLGICALTWASMVLLGGLISSLKKQDFHLVSSLLLLEAIRFVAAVFFSNLVTRKLVTFSFNPKKRDIHDWKRKSVVVFIRIVALAGQVLFVSPSIVLPSIALHSLSYPAADPTAFVYVKVVSESLRIFYTLVLLNACIAAAAVLYTLLVSFCLWCLSEKSDESLQRYYDQVVWRGVDKGLLRANDFERLPFALEVQAGEYSRRVPAKVVEGKYADLITYLYAETTGVEVVGNALDSSNAYLQQAAANIVGFWTECSKKEGKEKVGFPDQLLSKLADRINMGQTGWAAANSFHMLGRLDAERVFKVENQRGKRLVEVLMDAVEPGSGWSMVCVRAMLPLVGKLGSGEVESGKIVEFNEKLKKIMDGKKTRARERIQAAYALHQQGQLEEEEKIKTMVKAMEIGDGEYILQEELLYLEAMMADVKDYDPPAFTAFCKSRADVKDYTPTPMPFWILALHFFVICLLFAALVFLILKLGKLGFKFYNTPS